MEQSGKIFIDYIKEVVSQYNDIKQNHCENAQCILALNMNSMLLQDLDYVIKKNPQLVSSLSPALEAATRMRAEMIQVFGWTSSET